MDLRQKFREKTMIIRVECLNQLRLATLTSLSWLRSVSTYYFVHQPWPLTFLRLVGDAKMTSEALILLLTFNTYLTCSHAVTNSKLMYRYIIPLCVTICCISKNTKVKRRAMKESLQVEKTMSEMHKHFFLAKLTYIHPYNFQRQNLCHWLGKKIGVVNYRFCRISISHFRIANELAKIL